MMMMAFNLDEYDFYKCMSTGNYVTTFPSVALSSFYPFCALCAKPAQNFCGEKLPTKLHKINNSKIMFLAVEKLEIITKALLKIIHSRVVSIIFLLSY